LSINGILELVQPRPLERSRWCLGFLEPPGLQTALLTLLRPTLQALQQSGGTVDKRNLAFNQLVGGPAAGKTETALQTTHILSRVAGMPQEMCEAFCVANVLEINMRNGAAICDEEQGLANAAQAAASRILAAAAYGTVTGIELRRIWMVSPEVGVGDVLRELARVTRQRSEMKFVITHLIIDEAQGLMDDQSDSGKRWTNAFISAICGAMIPAVAEKHGVILTLAGLEPGYDWHTEYSQYESQATEISLLDPDLAVEMLGEMVGILDSRVANRTRAVDLSRTKVARFGGVEVAYRCACGANGDLFEEAQAMLRRATLDLGIVPGLFGKFKLECSGFISPNLGERLVVENLQSLGVFFNSVLDRLGQRAIGVVTGAEAKWLLAAAFKGQLVKLVTPIPGGRNVRDLMKRVPTYIRGDAGAEFQIVLPAVVVRMLRHCVREPELIGSPGLVAAVDYLFLGQAVAGRKFEKEFVALLALRIALAEHDTMTLSELLGVQCSRDFSVRIRNAKLPWRGAEPAEMQQPLVEASGQLPRLLVDLPLDELWLMSDGLLGLDAALRLEVITEAGEPPAEVVLAFQMKRPPEGQVPADRAVAKGKEPIKVKSIGQKAMTGIAVCQALGGAKGCSVPQVYSEVPNREGTKVRMLSLREGAEVVVSDQTCNRHVCFVFVANKILSDAEQASFATTTAVGAGLLVVLMQSNDVVRLAGPLAHRYSPHEPVMTVESRIPLGFLLKERRARDLEIRRARASTVEDVKSIVGVLEETARLDWLVPLAAFQGGWALRAAISRVIQNQEVSIAGAPLNWPGLAIDRVTDIVHVLLEAGQATDAGRVLCVAMPRLSLPSALLCAVAGPLWSEVNCVYDRLLDFNGLADPPGVLRALYRCDAGEDLFRLLVAGATKLVQASGSLGIVVARLIIGDESRLRRAVPQIAAFWGENAARADEVMPSLVELLVSLPAGGRGCAPSPALRVPLRAIKQRVDVISPAAADVLDSWVSPSE
jgi:hypothetical protein